MTIPLVVESAAPEARDATLVGGKAANLARLQGFGQPVSPWFAVTSAAFDLALRQSGLGRWIADRLPATTKKEVGGDGLEEIRGRILGVQLPAEVESAILEAHGRRVPPGTRVAVRSSALGEDTAADSFAGLHDSFLFLRGTDQILAAVSKVWASAYNDRAVTYRLSRGIPLEEIAVAVLVQEMVEATASGVMFTVNPNSGDVYELVISSLWGAGEGLVSAGLDADTFVVDKETLKTRATLAAKTEQLVLDRETGSGLCRAEVPVAARDASSLDAKQVLAVARSGLDIERAYGRPQDVEFSFDTSGRLFILQSRPVTTVEEYGPAAGNRLVWDNSNIIESYSGVTSPMTFSFIRHAYNIVYHCFTQVMGIHPDVVWRNRHTFQNMLGLFRGQVYYNLDNWYRLIYMFPGFNYNKKFMESMMGVRQSLAQEDEASEPSWLRRYFVELPALLRLVLRSTRNFLRIRKLVGDFEAHFQKHYTAWTAMDFTAMAPHELMALYREMEEELLWNWKAPIINDFFVMIFYGTLKKLCVAWCGDESGSLQNDLICGEGGIASTEPTKRLMVLAAEAARKPELRRLLLEEEPENLADLIPGDPRFPEFRASIEDYLERFGFRCVDELKLEEHSLKERPAFLYQVIRNYLLAADGKGLDPEAATEREGHIRREAERKAFAALAARRRLLPRRAIFRQVLANARLGVRNRENMRFARTQIYGLLRELLRAIGGRFAAEGLLEKTDDVFFLTIDEVWDFIKGTAVTTDLRGLVDLRRAEFGAYRADEEASPDDRFETFGMTYHRNLFKGRRTAAATSEDGVLRGIGCSPGVVTGPVKILRSPSEDARLCGEILVAERTDPGWVPLYPSVSGLLIERGSILSHSAIVAREMGIPTIVGIPGLSAALESGEIVTMDGSQGTVRAAAEEATLDSKEG